MRVVAGSVNLIDPPKNAPLLSWERDKVGDVAVRYAYSAIAVFPANFKKNLSKAKWCDSHDRAEYHIEKTLCKEVLRKLKASPEHPLVPGIAPTVQGVYTLYWNGELAYGGRARGEGGLKRRLDEHYHKVKSRTGIDPKQITCRFLVIEDDLTIRVAEHIIIEHQEGSWQRLGFGTKDKSASKWDVMFPGK